MHAIIFQRVKMNWKVLIHKWTWYNIWKVGGILIFTLCTCSGMQILEIKQNVIEIMRRLNTYLSPMKRNTFSRCISLISSCATVFICKIMTSLLTSPFCILSPIFLLYRDPCAKISLHVWLALKLEWTKSHFFLFIFLAFFLLLTRS